jgi:hypothetical protein
MLTPSQQRTLSLSLAIIALAWFALGTTVNTLVALASGKTIEIVVCTGAGMKKISVPSDDAGDTSSVIKHCSNAPIYSMIAIPGDPVHLHFEAPSTVAVWEWIPSHRVALDQIQVDRPPPGRAPPASQAD